MRRGLEQRIRRWLIFYPAEQRAEVLGVVLAGTVPGRRRPHPADVANLLLGAVRIRLRRGIAKPGGSVWRDAFALLGLVTSLLLCSGTLGFARHLRPPYTVLLASVPPSPVWPLWLPWPFVVVLSLLGLRRAAIALAWAAALGHLSWLTLSAGGQNLAGTWPGDAFWCSLALVAAASLSSSEGIRRAVALLGRWRTALVAVSAATLDYALTGVPFGTATRGAVGLVEVKPSIHDPATVLVVLPLLGIMAACMSLCSAPGRRHTVLAMFSLAPIVTAMAIPLVNPTDLTITALALLFYATPMLPLAITTVAASRPLRRRHST